MNEKEKKEFFHELSSMELADQLKRYADHPEERPYIEEFLMQTYCKKPYIQYEESLKYMPWASEETINKVKNARTYAVSIISNLLNFDDINSLSDIRTTVEHELEAAEGFARQFPT